MSGVCQVDPSTQTGCGKCIEPATIGSQCKATSDCQSGLVCALSAVTTDAGPPTTSAVCVTPAPQGASCANLPTLPVVPCQAGLLCDGSKCVTPLVEGSACDPAKPLCDSANNDFCTPVGKRCQAAKYSATGAECGYDAKTGDLYICAASGFCGNVSMMTGLGTCVAPAADMGMCDVAKGPLCMAPAFCNTSMGPDGGTAGTCTLVDPSSCH
jgi:hypothetical protein